MKVKSAEKKRGRALLWVEEYRRNKTTKGEEEEEKREICQTPREKKKQKCPFKINTLLLKAKRPLLREREKGRPGKHQKAQEAGWQQRLCTGGQRRSPVGLMLWYRDMKGRKAPEVKSPGWAKTSQKSGKKRKRSENTIFFVFSSAARRRKQKECPRGGWGAFEEVTAAKRGKKKKKRKKSKPAA